MIKKNQKILMTWNPSSKKHFENRGYLFTRYYDEFEVKIEDLTKGSNKPIIILCDYCGEPFPRPYYADLKIRKKPKIHMDNCEKCRSEKAKEIHRHRAIPWGTVLYAFNNRGYKVVTTEENYINGSTPIDYICEKHQELGIQKIAYHQLQNKIVRETGYIYIRGCKGCNSEKFREDLQNNPLKYYANRELYKIDIEVCKDRFEEKGFIFVNGQEYSGDKYDYKVICEVHPDEGVQEISLNDLLNKKYPCKACWKEGISKEKSHLWKGGKTDELRLLRRKKEYAEWREEVYKQDGYMCIACGDIQGGNLEAHHIENFSEVVEKRYEVENGVTLCRNCHDPSVKGSFHYIYSTQNNTKEQLIEFLSLKHQENGLSNEKIMEIREMVKSERERNSNKRPASTKLTNEEVYEIIKRLKDTDDSYLKIAKDYNVSQSRIYEIAKGLAFKDITKGRAIR
ncbi:HNH endonuclease [Rossellomorea vietnamensis]|uniref:HNH endonuclease n=1 Tax=Rossellomorea vietnamensis TaxID=218284 RepID=UPI000689A144|nr:HNH endonuclease [Rossellomorea vietnamensis]